MQHEVELKNQLAKSISSILLTKKNILESVVESQLSTDRAKYLEIFGEEKNTRLYTADGEIKTVIDSEGLTDFEALGDMDIKIFSYSDKLYPDTINKTNDITLTDITLSSQSKSESFTYETISACFIDPELNVSQINTGVPLPDKQLLLYLKNLLEPLIEESDPLIKLEFKYGKNLKISVIKEGAKYLTLCSKIL